MYIAPHTHTPFKSNGRSLKFTEDVINKRHQSIVDRTQSKLQSGFTQETSPRIQAVHQETSPRIQAVYGL